jgi:pectate lyase-like protein
MPATLNIPQLQPVPVQAAILDAVIRDHASFPYLNYFNAINPAIAAIDTALTNVATVVAAQGIFPVTVYGAVGDGVTDDGPAFRAAYAAAVANGGGTVYIPATTAFYFIATPIAISQVTPVTFLGAGRCSLVQRGAAMPVGMGVWDVQTGAANVVFDNFMFDGAVTVPVPLLYSAFNYDPLAAVLSNNTSFWLHDNVSQVRFSNMVIAHTGGYAILANAVAQDITDLYFYRLQLENNRPNLFGTNPTDINYGSWTGGVLFHGNGTSTTAMIRRAFFLSCTARCCTGNCYWQHLYGFSSLHESIHFTDMHGQDTGLDFIAFNGVMGYTLTGGTARRIGYVSLQDNVIGTPRYGAVAVDHAGLALSGAITGFSVTSANGGAFDCDGMGSSVVAGCYARVPSPGDPEYGPDQIATGFNFAGAYGINPGNSNNLPNAGIDNIIAACGLSNLAAGAIRMYGQRNGQVAGCKISHPSNAGIAPIQFGNLGAGPNQRVNGTVINGNAITWNPPTPVACIVEDGGLSAFTPDQRNVVVGNPIVSSSGAVEFQKAPGSSSVGTQTGTFGGQEYVSGMLVG